MDMSELEAAMKAAEEKRVEESGRGGGPYEKFYALGEGGIVNLYGPTKGGKTKNAITVAIDAAVNGYKVLYFDREHNIHKTSINAMVDSGVEYIQCDSLKDIRKMTKKSDADLIIVDSVTYHITGQWFEAQGYNRKGNLLLEVQNLGYRLQRWATDNEAMVIFITQPTSSFGDRTVQPMGDKLGFFCKETLWVERDDPEKPKHGIIMAKGSRVLEPDSIIMMYETEKIGVKYTYFSDVFEELM